MKKIISTFLICFILISVVPAVHAIDTPWQNAYQKVIDKTSSSKMLLMDVSSDGVPELFVSSGDGIQVYYFDGDSTVKAADDATIPYDFVKRLVRVRNTTDGTYHFMGQVLHGGNVVTYKMSFSNCVPVLEVLADENPTTGKGRFKGSANYFALCDNVSDKVAKYMEDYQTEHLMKSCMISDEVHRFNKTIATRRMFGRYSLLSRFSDDSLLFSARQRDEIKKNVGEGRFLAFDKITVLSDNYIFIEYYANNTPSYEYTFPYDKRYALVSASFEVIKVYTGEQELDPDYLGLLVSPETKPSNFNPKYEKMQDFRGIDDYVNYFSSLLSETGEVNENGKKEIANFMEYAVNKCSRTELKASDNILTVKKDTVSFVAQNAVNCMGQMVSVCNSKNIPQLRTAKTVPELVCSGIDLSEPVRIEFEKGVAQGLGQASGVRIMLDTDHGIYVNTAELAVLEDEVNVFSIEYKKNQSDYSIVFIGENNEEIPAVSMPVWFTVPAKSDYSSVIASFDGGTENRGGQYDSRYNTIEFSAVRSGNYQIVEEDITINDIDGVPFSANQAIRFLVSKGIMEVDRKNNFYPQADFSRYDFTKALVNMFYSANEKATCTYPDVDKESEYYIFVATAEEMDVTKPLADGTFGGNEAVTNEYIYSLCGKILAEKKGYKFPDNYVEYIAFSDKDDISTYSMPYIAVAVQCGLVENSGSFMPNDAVTREKGAEVLYKTFTLLYDTSPVTTSFSTTAGENEAGDGIKDLSPVHRVVVCVLFTAVLAFGFLILAKKRKSQEVEMPKDEDEEVEIEEDE